MKITGGLRFKTCPDCAEMHDKYAWPDNHRRPEEVLAAPNVIRDEMDAVQNQHDGKMYTSKRAMRASYRPSGNKEGIQLVEVGNDPARHRKFKKAKPDRKAIRTSLQKAQARFNNGERVSQRPAREAK